MSSWKLEADLGAGGLPRFLRDLADALEADAFAPGQPAGQPAGQSAGQLAGMPTGRDLRKLVLVAAADSGEQGASHGFTLKLKAKRDHEVRVPAKKQAAAKAPKAAGNFPAPKDSRPAKPAGDPKAADAAARAREKYRQLKKAMQADYKALQKAAEAGAMPAQDVLESFLALGESMAEMAQPLKRADGPEAKELERANAAYLDDARALRRAASARDAAALAEVLARLERRKSACHAQFR